MGDSWQGQTSLLSAFTEIILRGRAIGRLFDIAQLTLWRIKRPCPSRT